MFANVPTNVGISQRVVATLVASAVVLASLGFHVTRAQAANLVSVSNTLSDSDLGVDANQSILFTVPAGSPGVTTGQTITVTYPAGFNLTGVVFGDIDVEVNSVDQTVAATQTGATWGASVAGQVLTLTAGTGGVAASSTVLIQIGTNAAGGTNRINNPGTAGSYEIVITAGTADSGRTRVAIIDDVLVTAIVNTNFEFVISGTATATSMFAATSTGSTTATLIPFGELVAGVPELLVQRLAVTTNANNGFVVTVESDGNLRSSNGAIIDNFANGSDLTTPTAWSAPTNNINDRTTWGHWGLISNDSNLAAPFSNDQYIAASTTPRTVFTHNGPANGTTQDAGEAEVGYKIQISPLQEAADDYSTTLTYIATPTF